jgi:biotin carboxyl carrier protein
VLVGAKSYEVFVELGSDRFYVTVEGQRYEVQVSDQRRPRLGEQGDKESGAAALRSSPGGRQDTSRQKAGTGAVTSPMTGVLVEIMVEEEQRIKAGDAVAILEAMKTENVIRAPRDGTVKSIEATAGETLRMDDIVLYIDATSAKEL